MAIVTYNDNGTIKVVKFGNYVVSTDAEPVTPKEWVFLYGSTGSEGATYTVTGSKDSNFNNEGCASPSILGAELTSQSNPNGLAVGTKASIKMNEGTSICMSWAIFEVREV